MSAFETVHFLGIRHHGPGCARSVLDALEHIQPDCLLIEGPQEAEELLSWVGHEQLKPPVALLVYAQETPQLASFYPLAVFSPEWQAMRWANANGVNIQLFDLPHTHKLAWEQIQQQPSQEQHNEATDNEDENAVDEQQAAESSLEDDVLSMGEPLDALAQAAGFDDGETWWNRLVEERQNSQDLFAAINEAVTAAREAVPQLSAHTPRQQLEALREAWMRQRIRAAIKQGFERIVVVCGAWHVPALQQKQHSAKSDAALLKGLPKLKIQATWAPWSNQHLAAQSGYAAGVLSPGWYEHLWDCQPKSASSAQEHNTYRTVSWLSKVAHLLRSHDLDCSSAHVIETTRLAQSLAHLRGHSHVSLEEINEAILTVITMGETLPLKLVDEALNIGSVLGSVPSEVPMVPLQQDLQQQQKKLRLKSEALSKTLALDLRKELDLARSHFFHRLRLLQIDWARPTHDAQTNRGSFRESWQLQWRPEMDIDIIQASIHGTNVKQAATNKALSSVQAEDTSLPRLAVAIDQSLLANLPDLSKALTQLLQQRAAVSTDALQLMQSLAPLANVYRYGSVRQTDSNMLALIIDGLIERSVIGLNVASMNLNEEGAKQFQDALLSAHRAIELRQSDAMRQLWLHAVEKLMHNHLAAPLLRGSACRLLLDAKSINLETVSQQFSLNVSVAVPALEATSWLEGFINGQALVLLHHDLIWQALDAWVAQLPSDVFVNVLPLVRRCFADFSRHDREALASKVKQTDSPHTANATPTQPTQDTDHWQQAPLIEAMLCQLYGLPFEGNA